MAASSLPLGGKGGYTSDFVDDIPEDFYCLLCHHVARDPHIASCCGEHFCHTCIAPFLEEKQPCPTCSAEKFTTLLNVKYQRKFLQLNVYCSLKERGCQWVGLLSALDKHLDSIEGDCQFIDTSCPNECGQKVAKNTLQAHLDTECFERSYTCPYCSHQGTYKRVSEKHMDVCPYFPIRCPNFCGVTCEREIVESHMLICPLEKVECDFAFSGCMEKFFRDDQESHSEKYQKQHFAMLAMECSRLKKTVEEKDQEIGNLRELFLNEQHLKQKQVQQLQQKIKAVEATLLDLSGTQGTQLFRFPFHFTVTNFEEQRANVHNQWFSDSKQTHPAGYRFQIVVHPNGVGEGAGTHISLSLRPIKTLHEIPPKWPARCLITLQLMNQMHDQDHLTVSETLTWDTPTSASYIINFSRLFIKHKDLEWNAKKQTQYLYEDTLQFRIVKINVLSM